MSKHSKRAKLSLIQIVLIIGCIISAAFSAYSFVSNSNLFSAEEEKSEVYKEVVKNEKLSTKDITAESSSAEVESELSESDRRSNQLRAQMSYTQIYNPMADDRLDEGSDENILGNIVSPKIGLDIEFWQGTGYETGIEWSKDPASDDQRLLKATGMKKDQILGVDNVVFASHSAFNEGDAGKNLYFSPLLKDKNDNFVENPNVENLKLQKGDSIFVYQKSDNKTYEFVVSSIFISAESDGFKSLIDAQGDIKNRPQLTLYVCSNIQASARLVVQAEFIEKK